MPHALAEPTQLPGETSEPTTTGEAASGESRLVRRAISYTLGACLGTIWRARSVLHLRAPGDAVHEEARKQAPPLDIILISQSVYWSTESGGSNE